MKIKPFIPESVIADYHKGVSIVVLAAWHKVSYYFLHTFLVNRGVNVSHKGPKPKFTEEEIRAMVDSYIEGETPTAAGQPFGASYYQVLRIVRRLDPSAVRTRGFPKGRKNLAITKVPESAHPALLAQFDAGGRENTLAAIGARFGVTRERVRQIVKASGRVGRWDQARARGAQGLRPYALHRLTPNASPISR